MDAAAFETWLGSITSLTERQRQVALQAFARSDIAKVMEGKRGEAALADPTRHEDTGAAGRHLAVDARSIAEIGGHKVAVTTNIGPLVLTNSGPPAVSLTC
jgi:hypothetical protein